MPSIPPLVIMLVLAYLEPLLAWFSDYAYSQLLQHARDHFLVKLHQRLDLSPLEKACADYHHSAGPGRKPTHTVPRLVRALVIAYLYTCSLRQLETRIRFDLLVKWFVGYHIFAPGPDHSTLARFELWVFKNHPRLFFDTVLKQIDQDFPEEHTRPQVGDTFAMRANAAKEPLIRLIRHACQRLLHTLADVDPVGQAEVTAQLDQEVLFGAPGEKRAYALDEAQRRARLETTVKGALLCTTLVRTRLHTLTTLTEEEGQLLTGWLECLDKILADEVQITYDQGEITTVVELPDEKKGSYRLGSATDPDATYRVHGKGKTDFGYNVTVVATKHFIREIQADTGAQPDPVAIPEVLTAQREQHGFVPPKFIYDKAAGTGKTHNEVAKATDGQTQLVAPLIDHTKNSERFTPEDFTLSPDGQSLTCPNDQTTTTAYRSGSGEGRTFRFTAEQCAGCPLFPQCRGDKVPADHMRQVFVSDHRSVVAEARTYAQTPQFKQDMKLRPGIERIIFNLTNYHGARRARRRGQDKADFQAKMNGLAFNLRQWMRKLTPKVAKRSVAAAAA